MAVRIRMKKLGRRHRPFYRICAMDSRSPRDGTTIEELGTYDPMVKDVDARAVLDGERIDYWLGRGAQPTEKVQVLIKKYGTHGTHLEQQKAALEKLKAKKPTAPPPTTPPLPRKKQQAAREESGSSEDSTAAGTTENAAGVGGEEQGE
ncbi:MAG: 30S ribosomal protein S16 [Planctomycetota bacterium]